MSAGTDTSTSRRTPVDAASAATSDHVGTLSMINVCSPRRPQRANHSGAPVFDVEVVDVRHGTGGAVSRVHDAPGAPAALTELAPGKTLDRALEAGVDDPTAGVVVLEFLDSAGLRWRREGIGQPVRILGT